MEPEDAEVNAYMESANGEAPTDKERCGYYEARYGVVKANYKVLLLQKEELERMKDEKAREERMVKLTAAFRENYMKRMEYVTELRKLGVKVEDRFVPLSAR